MTRALIGLALWWGLLMAEGVGGAAALALSSPAAGRRPELACRGRPGCGRRESGARRARIRLR